MELEAVVTLKFKKINCPYKRREAIHWRFGGSRNFPMPIPHVDSELHKLRRHMGGGLGLPLRQPLGPQCFITNVKK